MSIGLRYTGHPFVDVGVATLLAFTKSRRPEVTTLEDVIASDIEAFVRYARELYLNRALLGYLLFVVFPNIVNPAVLANPKFEDQRRKIIYELFDVWQWQPGKTLPEKEEAALPDEYCVFSGDKAVLRVSQNVIPMIGGASVINFFPEGRPKLPIASWCVLALLAMPLGTLNASGKTFLVHSYDMQVLEKLVALNLERNRQAFLIESLEKRPNYKFPKTHLIQDLVAAEGETNIQTSIAGYLFVSGGQSPRIDIFHLSSAVINFISVAAKLAPNAWYETVNRAWQLQKGKTTEASDTAPEYTERNYFYEDLFNLPHDAVRFLKMYLLRQRRRGKVDKSDPRFGYSFLQEREVISWQLINLFLEKVMDMDKTRIEAIRQLADRLATYIQKVDSRFYKKLYFARNDYAMRREMLLAANAAKGQYHETLLPYDEFIEVFFIDEGDTRKPDWYLARDLLLIRIIEQLSNDWIEKHQADFAEIEEKTQQEETQAE